MKNFTKRISAILTSVLMASTMVVSASAASVTQSTTCTGNSASSNKCYVTSFGCPSGTDVNVLLSDFSSSGVSAALKSASNCSNTAVAGMSSKCVPSVSVTQSNSTAAKSKCGTTTSSSNCAANKTAAVLGSSTSGKCASSPTQSVKADTNSATSNSPTVSGSSATAKCGTFSTNLKSILKQFDFNTSNSSGTSSTQTSQNLGGDVAAPTPSVTGTTNSGSADSSSFEQQVVLLVNQQREANGLAPLTLSSELSNVARTKSQDMHDNNYFSHTSPSYGSPFDMLTSFTISYSSAGENIAMGYTSPEAVMSAWMNSPGHRANILNASYTQIGIGYVASGNYWTQEFIG